MKKVQSQKIPPEGILPTLSMIITQEGTDLPIDTQVPNTKLPVETKLSLDAKSFSDPKLNMDSDKKISKESFNQKLLLFEQGKQGNNRLRGRKKNKNDELKEGNHKEESKPENEPFPKSKTVEPVNSLISHNPEDEILEKNQTMNQIDEKEKKILRSNMNKYFKRANVVEAEKKNNDNKGTIPSKDINPNDLFGIDKLKKEINYSSAQKAYGLNVLTDTHKFMKNKLDKKLVNLVKRQVIKFERNLNLIEGDKFFILYELQVSIHAYLCFTDLVTLNVIKSIFTSFPSVHLIIMISDEELLNNNSKEYDFTLINEFSRDKLANILLYLNLDSNDQKRVHAFSSNTFKTKNKEFENQRKELLPFLDKPKVRKLFNLTTKEEEKNDLLLHYPCYLAVATNPSIYSPYIPEISSNHRCLIINSIFYMNRYQMCFDAPKILSFNEPAAIAFKIVPPISGINGKEAYANHEDENAILTFDEKISLNQKIERMSCSGKRNPNVDIACQYFGFLEEDNDDYNFNIKNYKEGKDEIKIKLNSLIQDMIQIFKEKNNNEIDTDSIMIN
jgi:hypothetical protein